MFKPVVLLATMACALALAACSKATAENYAKVETGMTHEQVQELLGKPDETSGGTLGGFTLSTEKWTTRKDVITVTYTGKHVAIKSIEPADTTAK